MTEKENSGIYDHILKYTSLFGGVQGITVLIGVVRNKILAMLLGTNGMGLMSLLNSAVSFISQSTNFGISFSAVRNISEQYDKDDPQGVAHSIAVVRAWTLMAAVVGMAVCVVAGPLLNAFSFSWGDHTLHFVLLSPAVGLLAVTGGETAILKATRRLGELAKAQVAAVALVLVVTVPLIWCFNYRAIVPLIVATALVSASLTVAYSWRIYPLSLTTTIGEAARGVRRLRALLSEGRGMVRLGVAFVGATAFISGAEMVIRALLNVEADLDMVGLYNAGYMITITYAGMVFTAMETDYYPRLSAVNHDMAAVRDVANKQIEVSLLILSPMLATLILVLPLALPLLFSSTFMPSVGMAQAAVMAMYLKAVSLPVAYITLSKSDSIAYLVLEGFYAVMLVVCVMAGFRLGGLVGTGIGITASYLVEFTVNICFTRLRYGFRVTGQVWKYMALQYPLGVLAYLSSTLASPMARYSCGIIVALASAIISVAILRQKTSLWNSLMRKFHKRHNTQ